MAINLLFVSIAFPPKSDPECIQTAKYFKYIAKSDLLNVEVLTSKEPTLFMPSDPYLEQYALENKHIYEIPIFENKYVNFLLRKISSPLIEKPDSKFTFHKQWKKAVRLIKQKPDIIYSRSFPLSSSVMALKLQRHFKIPWVMHLSDPWAFSPLNKYSARTFEYQKTIELECLDTATTICFSSTGILDFYKEMYPQFSTKYFLSPNVFDKENVPTNSNKDSTRLAFLYTGGLSGTRSPEPVLKAIRALRKQFHNLEDYAVWRFVGEFDSSARKIFNNYTDNAIKIEGRASYATTLHLQSESDILVILDSPLKDSKLSMFLPSKLLDYMASGKKIIAITNKNSQSDKFINENKLGVSYQFDEIPKIIDFFKKEITVFKEKGTASPFESKVNNFYSAEQNANRLIQLFESIIHN